MARVGLHDTDNDGAHKGAGVEGTRPVIQRLHVDAFDT